MKIAAVRRAVTRSVYGANRVVTSSYGACAHTCSLAGCCGLTACALSVCAPVCVSGSSVPHFSVHVCHTRVSLRTQFCRVLLWPSRAHTSLCDSGLVCHSLPFQSVCIHRVSHFMCCSTAQSSLRSCGFSLPTTVAVGDSSDGFILALATSTS